MGAVGVMPAPVAAPAGSRPFGRQEAFPWGAQAQAEAAEVGRHDLFNRKAFTWTSSQSRSGQAAAPAPASRPAPAPAPASANGAAATKQPQAAVRSPAPPERIYQVVAPSASVRAEPRAGAKLKTKKTRGARFLVSEVTMNGWLCLAKEAGWLLTFERNGDDINEIAQFVDDQDTMLAVPRHQPQGICCLEVVFRTGVPVRSAPDRNAETLSTRRRGEYVFAHTQTFDGWMRLAGEPGWMMAWSPEWGELLRPRPRSAVATLDVWVLSDAWACARRRPGVAAAGLTAKDAQDLKDLEQRMAADASKLFEQTERREEWVEKSLVTAEDLKNGDSWIQRRLFAGLFAETVREGDTWLQELLPGFAHHWPPAVPPVPGDEPQDGEEEDDGAAWSGAWGGPLEGLGVETLGPGFDPLDVDAFGGTRPLEFGGKQYTLAPNGVVFDPPNQIPMGIWNEETKSIDPAVSSAPGCAYASISYFGKSYLLMPDHNLVDPETEAIVGVFDPASGSVRLTEHGVWGGSAGAAEGDIPLYDPAFDDEEPTHPSEYLERGRQSYQKGRYKAAAGLFTEALKGCAQQRSVDLEFESEILRARCLCWVELESYEELLEDAERIIAGFSAVDGSAAALGEASEVRAWRRLAAEKLGRRLPGEEPAAASTPAAEAKCPQCNGLASRCATCGTGMPERCASCSKPVTRANCCSGCMCTYYCDRECQRAHWKAHKKECKKLAA